MATRVTLTNVEKRDAFARGVSLASAIDRPCVLNTDAKTAASNALDIAGILASDAAVVEMDVPPGANYLKMCLVYTGASVTAPVVRCFGRVPILPEYSSGILPKGVDASYGDWTLGKGDGQGLWVPRGNDALGVYALTLPTTAAMTLSTGTYCEPIVVHVGGCDRVVVPIVTAATAATLALVYGWFEQ